MWKIVEVQGIEPMTFWSVVTLADNLTIKLVHLFD